MNKGLLTFWETVKALLFGWRDKCACGENAYWIDDESGERRCSACAQMAEGKTPIPETEEYQSLRDEIG